MTDRSWPPPDSPYRMIAESGRTKAQAMADEAVRRTKRLIDEAHARKHRRDEPPEPVAVEPGPGPGPKSPLKQGAEP